MKYSSKHFGEKFKSTKQMSIEDIVKKDIAVNGKRLGVTLDQGITALTNFKTNGATFKRVGNTLFIIFENSNGIIKYHSVNGDPLKTFLYNCLVFFSFLHEQGYTQAITYFSDSYTQKLLQKYKLQNQAIEPSNDPKQGAMMLVTNLTRSA